MAEDKHHRLTDGVSVAAVRTFLKDLQHEFPASYTDMTTKDACQQLVVPRTKQPNCAYVDLLRRKSPTDVGKATVFVSHAWRYKITDVLNTLLEFAEEQNEKGNDGKPVFFWFDLFMNNQNVDITANLPQDWWSTTFKQSIANIGRVLLVLMPWHDPVPLTRAWCLWEIFCGISNKGTKVDIQLPQREEEALEHAICDSFKAVRNMLLRVDAERAEAYNENDKAMIFKAIEAWAGGFGAVNQAVKDQLRAWCLSKAISAVEAKQRRGEDGTIEFAELCHQVGGVLDEFGDPNRAMALWQAALPIYLKTKGETADVVAILYCNLGQAHAHTGDVDTAIAYYELADMIVKAAVGDGHPSIAITYNSLGVAYNRKGDYEQAIVHFEHALEIFEETLEEKTSSMATFYSNLGNAYENKGECDKAIASHEKAHEILQETVGAKHPTMALVYHNLGNVYTRRRGEHDKAIAFYGKARKIMEQTFGTKHPKTACIYSNLGAVYATKGEYDKALMFYNKDLLITRDALGEKHTRTAHCLFKIGMLHKNAGSKEKALPHVERAVQLYGETLGLGHPCTVRAKQDLLRLHTGGTPIWVTTLLCCPCLLVMVPCLACFHAVRSRR